MRSKFTIHGLVWFRVAGVHQRVVDQFGTLGDVRPPVVLAYSIVCFQRTDHVALFAIANRPSQCADQAVHGRLTEPDQIGRQHFGYAADVGGDHLQAAGDRLDDRDAERLGERGVEENIAFDQNVTHLIGLNGAE